MNNEYRTLVFTKTYDEMTESEFAFCTATEIDYYKDRVNKLRKLHYPDYKIAAYIHDLWQSYLIADDVELAEAYNISDKDWEKGINYYWYDMEESNPLKD